MQHFLHVIEDKDARVRVAGVRAVAAIFARCVSRQCEAFVQRQFFLC